MPITTVRPDADRNIVNWLHEGSGSTNLYQHIDDEPADTTSYIAAQASWPSGYYRARIADLPGGIPSGQRLRAVRIRVLAASHTNNTVENVYYTLRDPTYGADAPRDSSFRDQTGFSQGVGVWRTTDLQGQEWTSTAFARLEVEVFSKSYFARLAEVYVDADLRALGTLSGVTVTEETLGSRPLVGWTFTPNSDGDRQLAFQVKVFTAAAVATAGFDPAVATAVWDSGQVGGSVAEARVGVDLANGVSYVAYVRVSQDFNGAKWWTDWQNDPFTMAFSPPATPTLAATADFVLPSYRVLLEATAAINQLTAQAASFEDAGLGTTGWLPLTANTTLSRSVAQASDGGASMLMGRSVTTGTAGAATFAGTSGVRVAPGSTVNGFASFRAVTTARSCRLLINFYDDTGTLVAGTLTGSSVTDSTSAWTQASVSGPAPVGAAYMQLQAEALSAVAGEGHYLDQAALGVGLAGWSAGAGDVGRQVIEYCDQVNWHDQPVNLLHPLVASAGDPLGGTSGFYPRTGTVRAVGQAAPGSLGEDVLTWSPAATGTPILDVGSPLGGADQSYSPALYPGLVHTFSAYARITSGSATVRLGLQAIDGAGATVGSATTGTAVALSTSWQRLTATMAAPATPTAAVDWRPFFERTAGAAPVVIDRLQLELPAAGCDPTLPSEWEPGGGLACGWQPVRGALTALVLGPDGVARIYDREIPPGGARLYRAKNELAYADGTVVASAWSTPLLVAGPPAPGQGNWVLKDPYDPTLDALVCVTSWAEAIEEDLAEFHLIRPDALVGFGQRPVFASDWISGDNGTLAVTVTGARAWWSVRQLLTVKRSLLLQPPEGGQRWVRLTDRSWPRAHRPVAGVDWRRQLSLGFKETERPRVLA